jgi:hypothetical protein
VDQRADLRQRSAGGRQFAGTERVASGAPTDGTPITLTATASEANPGHTYEVFIH